MKKTNALWSLTTPFRNLSKKLIHEAKSFASSYYFAWKTTLGISIIAGIAFTVFPAEDLSIAHLADKAARTLTIETAVVVLSLMMWIMFVSHKLDEKFDWDEAWTKRITRQLLFGFCVPIAAWVVFIILVYGTDMFGFENMQFVFAVYVLFLGVVNFFAYLLHFNANYKLLKANLKMNKVRRAKGDRRTIQLLKEQLKRAQNKSDELREDFDEQRKLLDADRSRISELEKLLLVRDAELLRMADEVPAPVYELKKHGVITRAFLEEQISGFIAGENIGKRPIIDLFQNRERISVPEDNLTKLGKKFSNMIRLNRQSLVGQHTILSVCIIDNRKRLVAVDFLDEPVEVSADVWKKVEDRVLAAIAVNVPPKRIGDDEEGSLDGL